MADSKVFFNLKNVHYAILTETESQGVITESFGTPVKVPGAVSISIDAEGDMTPFYADGIKYYISQSNAGYSGSLEMAKIPDSMLEAVWGMAETTTTKILIENVETEYKYFALLFQIDGDADETLYAFYKVSASRPSIASSTNTESKEPGTQSIEFSCASLSDGSVMGKTTADTTSTARSGWFTSVQRS